MNRAELNSITNLSRKAISSSGLNFATLTKTTPSVFLKRKWNEPKFTKFSARDGKKVPAKIYFPANFDKSKKHPMVIFVHGAGYLQNVINGWNNYYREFMFNQLLTQKGYVVLDIDYRGSAGYGRDWRTDVYDFLGGKDYTDHIDGIDFMVKNYNIDQKRIGTYGGSYGGFMAAHACRCALLRELQRQPHLDPLWIGKIITLQILFIHPNAFEVRKKTQKVTNALRQFFMPINCKNNC